ncbi:hypothetical protein NKDENANG_03105 [Candidatus Entotheonellaceae bacterium PAL068K]
MRSANHRYLAPELSWRLRLWLRLSSLLVDGFFHLIARPRIEGLEHLPSQGGVVLVSNHISMLDTLLIPCSVMTMQGVQVVWAPAKAELFKVPIVGPILTSWGVFPVRRDRGDLLAIRRILKHMRTGKVMLFPEGTRSRDGRLGTGKRMVGKLLYTTRPVVIPAVVWGTDRVWATGRIMPRFRTPIGVRYGKPLDLERYYMLPDTKETAAAIVAEVMQAIAALMVTVEQPFADEACHEV